MEKGDKTGTFHFGGSMHPFLFRPETGVNFAPDYTAGVISGTAIMTTS